MQMADYFISYTGADKDWAEWIAYVLEEQGLSTRLQAWDFRPGSNFVLEMQNATEEANRTIIVLSPDYLQSAFAAPEWAAAFSQDPKGADRKVVPVMVRACNPKGLLAPIVQIRIFDLDEQNARTALLQGLKQERAKPLTRPLFPGSVPAKPKEFPGVGQKRVETSRTARKFPTLKSAPSDIDRRRCLKEGFETIRWLFEENGKQFSAEEPRVHIDTEMRTTADLRAELFVDGKRLNGVRVWLGGMHSDDTICYAEGSHFSDNSCNEIVYLNRDNSLSFSATMAMGYSDFEKRHDVKNMNADLLAEYFWSRFISPLERGNGF